MTFTPSPQGHQGARQGYLLSRALLFVPALGLLAFSLWQRSEAPAVPASLDEPTEPMRTGAVGSIDGWEGLVVRDGAAPLRLRLERLHPEAGRQAFDASALAAALRPEEASVTAKAVADGGPDVETPEPWRLTLSVAARPGSATAYATVVENLSEVRIEGLGPLVPSGASTAALGEGKVDPLVALMDFPDAPLLEGESCDLIFWGLSPEGPVRAMLPVIGDVQLLVKARSANRSTVSIARLDARSLEPSNAKGSTSQGSGR